MADQTPLFPSTKTTMRLPQDSYRRLKVLAIEQGRSVQDLLADAVELYLASCKNGASVVKEARP